MAGRIVVKVNTNNLLALVRGWNYDNVTPRERLLAEPLAHYREQIRVLKRWFSVLLASFLISGCALLIPERTVRYILYPVKQGDTVSELATRFGTTVDKIITANDIEDPRGLEVGRTIKIPFGLANGNESTVLHRLEDVKPDKKSVKTISLSSAKKYIGNLEWPVRGRNPSSLFGYRWLSFHEGIDIPAELGVDIHAAHDGVVVYSSDGLRGYGNLVILKGDGILTVYAHNDSNIVEEGDRVRKGDTIAYVGASGKAQGAHVHFETRIRVENGTNVAVDPRAFFRR